ncbi:uncharacterized protein LOC135957894 [Calliphora vicina]|uniref:uncharacterized protein LOC135957894 n=1 Tax=Calliphora vicina TaxID=7373 RepID=UPI00325BA32B
MYNKSKARQSIKVEKENENFELRKKIKYLTTDKHLVNKKETVWDRLSKVKKAPSTENVVGVNRSRPSLTTKTSQHFQSNVVKPFNPSVQLLRKPLSPTASSINKRSNVPKRLSLQKPTVVSDIKKEDVLHIMPVNDILTARSFSDESKSSSGGKSAFRKLSNTSTEYICSNDLQVNESSEESNEEYKLAPLMNSGHESMSSMRILRHVREFLRHKDNAMPMEDIELVKDVVKSDSRYRNLDKNPKLFKDILKTQLQNVLKHEFAIKKALDSLEPSASLQQSLEIESTKPINKIVSYSGHNKETQKFEVDVIFKNVPSLDKEIEILRALGEKLEATLRSTTCHRSRRDDSASHRSISSTTKPLLIGENKNLPVMYKLKHEVYVLTAEYNVEVTVQLIGISHHIGIVNEFYMAQKTIAELKRESNRPFYIPSNSEGDQLIRTCFKQLKETPSELLRHVKPRNSKIAFNVLEQDPIFFNNVFHKTLKLSNIPYNLSTSNDDQCVENQLSIKQSLCDGGDGIIQIFGTPTIVEPVIRGKQRRRIRRCLTPMPFSSCYNPKTALFKTILVGIVQMSVFIIFIMALTYPDVRC